jgi:hypothetical protein
MEEVAAAVVPAAASLTVIANIRLNYILQKMWVLKRAPTIFAVTEVIS